VQPTATSGRFGLNGGTSSWKTNAPSIDVVLNEALQVAGWVTQSSDPNDDNIVVPADGMIVEAVTQRRSWPSGRRSLT
jgi:hypothetical protein